LQNLDEQKDRGELPWAIQPNIAEPIHKIAAEKEKERNDCPVSGVDLGFTQTVLWVKLCAYSKFAQKGQP